MKDLTDKELYEQLKGPLMRFAIALVGPDDAPDLVSEVVVGALSRGPLSSLESPQAYLMASVVNRARSRHRRSGQENRRRSVLPLTSEPSDDQITTRLAVTDAINRLPVRQKAAVYLVYWADLDSREAGNHMGVRPATVRRYLHLAKRSLRRYLDG